MKLYIIQIGKNCLIESLLQIKYDNRPNINKVIDSFFFEDLKKSDKEKNIYKNTENKLKEKNLENESNKINQNIIINNLDNIKKNDNNYPSTNNNFQFINGMNKNFSLHRLRQEYELCTRDNDLIQLGCNFGLECNNLYKWRITLLGPKNTPYEGGLFTLLATFPEDYPNHGPEIKFLNKIYHLNVDFNDNPGYICHDRLNEWKITGKVNGFPFYTMKQAIYDIFCLFYHQIKKFEIDDKFAEARVPNVDKFNEEARRWTQLYASIF